MVDNGCISNPVASHLFQDSGPSHCSSSSCRSSNCCRALLSQASSLARTQIVGKSWTFFGELAMTMLRGYLVVHPTNRKWVITLVINGISGVSPLITRVITHLLSGMNHQVKVMTGFLPIWSVPRCTQMYPEYVRVPTQNETRYLSNSICEACAQRWEWTSNVWCGWNTETSLHVEDDCFSRDPFGAFGCSTKPTQAQPVFTTRNWQLAQYE